MRTNTQSPWPPTSSRLALFFSTAANDCPLPNAGDRGFTKHLALASRRLDPSEGLDGLDLFLSLHRCREAAGRGRRAASIASPHRRPRPSALHNPPTRHKEEHIADGMDSEPTYMSTGVSGVLKARHVVRLHNQTVPTVAFVALQSPRFGAAQWINTGCPAVLAAPDAARRVDAWRGRR